MSQHAAVDRPTTAGETAPAFLHGAYGGRFGLHREKHFALDPDVLAITTGKTVERIPYSSFTRVRVLSILSQSDGVIGQCKLHSARGTVLLRSANAKGILNVMEDRTAAYKPFVRELVLRIAQANPNAAIFVGASGATRVGWLFTFGLGGLMGFAGIVIVSSGTLGGFSLLGAGAAAASLAWKSLRKNSSHRVSCAEIATGDLGL